MKAPFRVPDRYRRRGKARYSFPAGRRKEKSIPGIPEKINTG
jgi:hypothetical protein